MNIKNSFQTVMEAREGGICAGDRGRRLKVPGSRCLVGVALKFGGVEHPGGGRPREISLPVMVIFALVGTATAGRVATTNDGGTDPVARRGAPPGVSDAI